MRVLRRRLVNAAILTVVGLGVWFLAFHRSGHEQTDVAAAGNSGESSKRSAAVVRPPQRASPTPTPSSGWTGRVVQGQHLGVLDTAVHPLDDMQVVEGVGEDGNPVTLDREEQEEADRIIQTEAFNELASNRISLHRRVPDTRDSSCRRISYEETLPDASVILIFTDEAWSALIRTIWSVLDQAKHRPETVKEIILVDDFSSKSHLGRKLEEYIQKRFPPKVKLIRLPKREGLIRARLAGARLATGDVLVFLDSHCECGPDWLQPLLKRIKEDNKVFAVPIIDVIDDKTLQYHSGNGNYFQIGGFTWMGHFTWIDIPEWEQNRRTSHSDPLRTPTMAGGLFAVDRQTFWDMGSYDEEMDVWGGENLEMSFRVWQCGGSIETIPCSRVGHIFRNFHPYKFPGDKDTHGINTARTVEIWMDDYKKIFYLHRPDLLQIDIGDLTARKKFREDKQCKSFDWFLSNVYPQKFIPTSPQHAQAYGRVHNKGADDQICLDTMLNDDKDEFELGAFQCNDFLSTSQFFSLSKGNEIRHEDNCAEVEPDAAARGVYTVRMKQCDVNNQDQKWKMSSKGRILHVGTKRCLDVATSSSGPTPKLTVSSCKRSKSQLWYFDNNLINSSSS